MGFHRARIGLSFSRSISVSVVGCATRKNLKSVSSIVERSSPPPPPSPACSIVSAVAEKTNGISINAGNTGAQSRTSRSQFFPTRSDFAREDPTIAGDLRVRFFFSFGHTVDEATGSARCVTRKKERERERIFPPVPRVQLNVQITESPSVGHIRSRDDN